MLWRAMHTNSLWAVFFRAKHIQQSQIMEVTFKHMKGHGRRCWIQARNLIVQHKKVIIGDGSSTNFWVDTWLGNKPLQSYIPLDIIPNLKASVSHCIQQPTNEETQVIESFLPTDVLSAIKTTKLSQLQDKEIWSLSSSGHCVVSSVYKSTCSNSPALPQLPWSRLWSKWLPPKISLLLWKIINNCIPSDSNVQSLGIHMCSK